MKFTIFFIFGLILTDLYAPVHLYAKTISVNSTDDCIEIALENNQNIKLYEERLKGAKAQILEATSTALPHISFQGLYTRLGNNTGFPLGQDSTGGEPVRIKMTPDGNWTAKLTLDQVIYSGGKVGAALHGAKYYRLAADRELDATRQGIILQALRAYYLVLLAKQLVHVNEESLQQVEASLEDMKHRRDKGVASDFDVLRAEVETANTKPGLIRANNDLTLSLAQLKLVLGLDPLDEVNISGELGYIPLIITLEEAIQSALDNRPEIEGIEANIEGMKSIEKFSRSGLMPQINLQANYQWSKDDLKFTDEESEFKWRNSWNINGIVSLNLFDGLETFAKMKKAKADTREVEYQRELLINGIKLEVESSYANLENAMELIHAQEKSVEQAAEGWEIAQVSLRQGLMTLLEANDTRLALTLARTYQAQAYHDYMVARAELRRAMGTLDDPQ
ncbi:MAG: hypothetical protein B6244_00840 [Candidatus Cloacimonetes bacterium 4572_55]|nr:MAG: hypothetical protein B6244_00840 [Candidatus Cloacimonetes bacterium 4572_55]